MNEQQILDKSKLLGATIFDDRNNLENTFLPTHRILFTIVQLKQLVDYVARTEQNNALE